VSQANDDVVIETRFEPGFSEFGSCRLAGKLVQQGSIASIQGTSACEFSGDLLPIFGTFEISDIELAENGFNGLYRGTEGACQHAGRIGGIRLGHPAPVPAGPSDPTPTDPLPTYP
jgi:hypothetical protein